VLFTRQFFPVIALSFLVLAGCATPPKPEAITVVSTPSFINSPRTLRVAEVTGGQATETSSVKTTLGNDEFHEALVASLSNAGAFQRVVSAGDADWELRATIASQAMRGAFKNTAELMIRYEVFDLNKMRRVWGETVYSHQDMRGFDELFQHKRARVLIEATAKQNIADFIDRLGRWLPSVSG